MISIYKVNKKYSLVGMFELRSTKTMAWSTLLSFWAPRTPRGQSKTKANTKNIKIATQGIYRLRHKKHPISIENKRENEDVSKIITFCVFFEKSLFDEKTEFDHKNDGLVGTFAFL